MASAKPLQTAPPFELSKLEASLPFEVTIGMIFIGTYIGGRIQDRRGPRIVALVGGVRRERRESRMMRELEEGT